MNPFDPAALELACMLVMLAFYLAGISLVALAVWGLVALAVHVVRFISRRRPMARTPKN